MYSLCLTLVSIERRTPDESQVLPTMEITQSKESRPEHIDEKGVGPDFTDTKALNADAAQATAAEHSLGLVQALKTYKRAAMWSVCK